MIEPKNKFQLAVGYQIGRLSRVVYAPENLSLYIYYPNYPDKGSAQIRSLILDKNRGLEIYDSTIFQIGEITTPMERKDLTVKLKSKSGTYLMIFKSEIPLYIKLGILIPLDAAEVLAHEYGIL